LVIVLNLLPIYKKKKNILKFTMPTHKYIYSIIFQTIIFLDYLLRDTCHTLRAELAAHPKQLPLSLTIVSGG